MIGQRYSFALRKGMGASSLDPLKRRRQGPFLEGTWAGAWGHIHQNNGRVYFGSVDNVGNIWVGSCPDGTSLDQAFMLNAGFELDYHVSPSLLVRDSDSKVLVFYCQHTGANMYYRLSASAEDVSAWGAETDIDGSIGDSRYTYPIPIQLLDEADDPIYLFYRGWTGAEGAWYYTKSTDDGATWAARTLVYTEAGKSPYCLFRKNGEDRIDFIVATEHLAVDVASIYHGYYEGGSWYKSDGTVIAGGLPLDSGDLTLIYDGSAVGATVCDLTINASGNPVVIFYRYPVATDHRCNYAIWNGSSWSSNEIVAAGGPYVTGGTENYAYAGAGIDRTDHNIVYVGVEVSGNYEILKYTTEDGGSSWSSEAITENSPVSNGYVRAVENRGATAALMWMGAKTMVDYDDYKSDLYLY